MGRGREHCRAGRGWEGTDDFRMLLQTNSYIVPKEKRAEHTRLVRRFRQTLARLGCEHFEVYEQVGANWGSGETTGRFVHIMRFHDRKHQLAVQAAERNDAAAQALINEFCELINFPYQQQQGLFAVGFYQGVLPVVSPRATMGAEATSSSADDDAIATEVVADDAPSDSPDDNSPGDVKGLHIEVDQPSDDDDAPSDQPSVRHKT